MAGGNLMGYTIVRGGALIGIRLCLKCKDNYYQQDLDKKPECQVCGNKVLDGVQVNLCRYCSATTGVCQDCGAAIGSDDELVKKKKPRKKKISTEKP